ncbi:MAG TPA: hypothetical protein GX702_03430 [Chloroflexi bacterium]|nr:hypothetical protein [Chloroflexota bacterium]
MIDSPWIVVALSSAALISAILAIRSQAAGLRRRYYLFKPLTTGLILLLAPGCVGDERGISVLAIAVGLFR